MSSDFDSAVKRISEVVMFENWLRFYFIEEEGDKLFIRLPDMAMDKLRASYPRLYGLAERLNDTEIDHKTSLSAVCLFVASEIDGAALPEALIGRVFDSTWFHLELQLFTTWVQSHEDQLDETFMEFTLWQSMFEGWKKSPKLQDYIKGLVEKAPVSVHNVPETTQ